MLSPQLFLCFTISFAVVSAQSEGTCVGRCGQGYIRADPCHCDYNCMSYMECCPDYKTVCTTEGSCQGRCHEGFIRGQTCDCDPSCVGLGRCCPDFEKHCVQPVQKQPPPTPSPQQPDPDPKDNSPKPTRKPEENTPEDEIQKDEAVPKKAKTKPINRKDPPQENQKSSPSRKRRPRRPAKKRYRKVILPEDDEEDSFEENAPSTRLKKKSPKKNKKYSTPKKPRKKKKILYEYEDEEEDPNKRSPRKNKKNPQEKSLPKKKKKKTVVESEEEIKESEENLSSSSFSSSSSSSSVKGTKKTKKLSRKNPKKPQDGDDTPDPDNPEPTLDDKDKKPKKPNVKDDDEPEDPDPLPKDPNQKNPDDKDGKPRKPESPKPKDRGDGPGNPGKTPGERSPGDDDDPQKTKTPKVVENTEDEDSPRKPLLSDKEKRSPTSKKPKKKKKVNPEDDEPLKPGKEKNPKKKPSPKDIVKRKKKINSEEERQETVESEFSSSSQSSSSHSRSKSTRRTTGKNKKNKKKFPEEPEDPLMPPNRKKYPSSTPAYTTPDEGSGDEGSGIDFLQTTIVSTTIRLNTTTPMPTTVGTKKTETLKTSVNPQTESINGTTTNIPITVSTEKQAAGSSATTVLYTESSTQEEKTKGLDTTTGTTPQQMSTLNTPQDQSTADSNVKHTTPGLEKTDVQHKSTPMGPTKHTPRSTESGLTTTSSHSSIEKDSKTSQNTQSMDQSTNIMNEYSTTSAPLSTLDSNESQSQTKDIVTTSIPKHTPTTPNHKDSFITMPVDEDDIETSKATTPHTIHPHHICNLLKDEAISLKIPESDLDRITEICADMQQQYPNVNIPSLQTRQPNIDDRKIPPGYPLSERTPSIWYQQPGSKIIQIIEEINRRMNTSPLTNLTGIPSENTHKSTAWLLLMNKIRLANDPQMNLCIGPPADGMTTMQNGSLVVFRGNYFWTLNQGGVTDMPRKISEVWGIPSPIDTVFTRCNCGGKTFFFKGPRYWRFTNDVMDKGYPKEIIKGFGGLNGKVTSVLSVAGYKTRPESVYFFKPGGNVQKYTFRQEQSKRCTKKKQPSVNYPIYSQKVQTVKFRFPRNIMQHRIQIRRTFTNIPQPLGVLHAERSVRSTWRGIPSNIVSAVSLPNPQKQDGFDYFVFSKEKYYNINMSSKVAMKPPAEQKTTKDWYKCKE
ncbi:proteoglycan 4 isoform 3-T3 [Mantella aurantiaca]